jgi:putative transposase
VTRSHSRPHTSNDNPFSEAHFKTLKYQPTFPGRFASMEEAQGFCRGFFDWYNREHHHVGIGLMTPNQVHYGQADAVFAARQATLDQAFVANPERFVRKNPVPPAKPAAVWINPPITKGAVPVIALRAAMTGEHETAPKQGQRHHTQEREQEVSCELMQA